jgi:uncharacterized membrane protein SpoIIM required for sporulation
VTLERFESARRDRWAELETLLGEARGHPERLGPERLLRLGELYRSAAADLALARRRYPRDPVRGRLETLVRRAGLAVYGGRAERGSLAGFLTTGYWRALAERPWPLAIAAIALLAPAALACAWAIANPGAAAAFIPAEFAAATEPPSDAGTTAAQEAVFSAELFTHNIQVTFLAFALGITAGLGTGVLLAYNGLLLGAITGAAFEAGNGSAFVEFLIPHGPLELSCIVVTAAAGIRLGWSLVEPGDAARSAAFAAEGRRSIGIVLGTMPWLVLAGLLEAFVRSQGLPGAVPVAVGIAAFAIFWGLVIVRGRGGPEPTETATTPSARAAPAPSPAGTS